MDRTTSSVVLALLPTKISSVFELFLHFFVFAQKTFLQFLTISFVGLVLRHADEISLRTYFLTGPKLALIFAAHHSAELRSFPDISIKKIIV